MSPVWWTTLLAWVCLLTVAAPSSHGTIGNVPIDAAYGPIDAVYTWVNGSDPIWQKEKAKWHATWRKEHNEHPTLTSSDENRFRDNDELRYSIRSLYMYAPWIRHIYIVTDGQTPVWLDRSHPHVSIVPHAAFFRNASHLPTFASPSIEANLDWIPELSANFLYLNDDMLLGAPVSPQDFMSRNGTQNVYLAWEAPACSDECANWMLGDGVCHRACNTRACGFDHGDCTCASPPVVSDDWTPICSAPEDLGDGHCQVHCNVAECAFDAGDCDPTALDLLPRVTWNASVNDAAVLLGAHRSVLVVDDIGSVETEFSALVQHAAVLRSRLFLFFNRTVDETITLTLRSSAKQMRLRVVPRGVALASQGYAVARRSSLSHFDLDLAAISITPAFQPQHLDATIYVPFASLPDWSGDTRFAVDDGTAISCPAIDTASSATALAESHCTLNASGVLVHARPGNATRTSVCLFNGGRRSCIVLTALSTVLAPTVRTLAHYALPKTTHECHWWAWCNATYATLAESCTTASTKARMANDPSAAKAKAMTLCTRFGAAHGPLSRNATQLVHDKMCRIMRTKDQQPFWLDPCRPRDVTSDEEITFLDPFGDSLKHVNTLFDAAFGKAPVPRRVPAHMPYFIQKRVLSELKAHWPTQFNATSSHRFRHPRDMQFSFAYMHYVANRRLLHPPQSATELISSVIDINQNGLLDQYEVRNLLGLFPQSSHAVLYALLDDCHRATKSSSSLPLQLIAAHCPGLERRLGQVDARMLPPTHRRMSQEQVTFLMLGRSMTDYVQLYRARSRRTKFVCVNDDISSPSPVLCAMLRDFFQVRWSTPSPVELTIEGSLVSEKRRFKPTLHHDVVYSGFVWPYELAFVGVLAAGTLYVVGSTRRRSRSYHPLPPQ
ncbi:hypothetical protein SDRG_10058 [Saprolegnia diclina VS20]|uniref:LNR domain-containing protein n=1 Tax=Saprolegnia diclina (strain VS20) TaxID=1156394 RepID=T0QC69_SAPDV|nr:hypothetical protein SDRG_10058 [Saprolegnia diclina VS20]EQC32311.1 hypothetical protein SDRG_10058 [Saprolegnia diclina VS20]|eukprot:XP_008614252.1 hypothetical protein SDRG_10058 [Saprolegnia diclina VS20]